MGIDFRRPRHIRGFRLGEVLIFGPGIGRVLVEKTVSGAIAHIEDGADDVPTKSLIVTIPPTLDGVSSVTETQTGRNLCQNNLSTETVSDVTITVNADGTITLNGTASARIVRNLVNNFELKAGNYILSCGTSSLPTSCYLNINGGGISVSCSTNTPSKSFALASDSTITYIRIDLANGSTFNNFMLYPMLEYGSTAHAYEPYQTPTQYTASLGRTIYGGTPDIVNGVGTENISAPTALNSLTWSKTTVGGHDAFYSNLPNGYIGQGSGMMDADCDTYDITTDSNLGTDRTIRFYYNANFNITRCVIRDDQYASYTGAQFKEAVTGDIVYQLADSARTDFTFDGQEINTRLGYNAFWSEQGDNTEVTYYAYAD